MGITEIIQGPYYNTQFQLTTLRVDTGVLRMVSSPSDRYEPASDITVACTMIINLSSLSITLSFKHNPYYHH